MCKNQTAKAMRDQGASYETIASHLQISLSAARGYVWRANNPEGMKQSAKKSRRKYELFGDKSSANDAARAAREMALRNGASAEEAQLHAATARMRILRQTYAPNLHAFVGGNA